MVQPEAVDQLLLGGHVGLPVRRLRGRRSLRRIRIRRAGEDVVHVPGKL